MRLFVAVQLSDNIRNALIDIQDAMRAQGVRGNYTKAEKAFIVEMEVFFVQDFSLY